MDCNRKVKTVKLADTAIDTRVELPDYIFAEIDVEDPATGNVISKFVREPAAKLFPNVNNDNVSPLEINNSAISVPENQVRAGYVSNEPGANVVKYADKNHAPVFLMLGLHSENIMRIQTTGVVNIPEGHRYLVGQQYWSNENGEPVTDSTITGHPLFIPISSTQLVVTLFA